MGFFDRLEKIEELKKKAKEKKERKKKKQKSKTTITTPMYISPYRELNEQNIVLTVWDSETGGVKVNILALVFGRHKLREIRSLVQNLVQRRILIRDRNWWIHINPYFAKQVLEHYGIPFDDREVEMTMKDVAKRIDPQKREELRRNPPQF